MRTIHGDDEVQLDGSTNKFTVHVAGYRYVFQMTDPADASFTLVEWSPHYDEPYVLTGGAEY